MQPDKELVGVSDVTTDYRIKTAVVLDAPVYASVSEKAAEVRGLRISLPQTGHLFGLREDVCARVLGALVDEGLLARRSDGRYGRKEIV